MLPVAELLQLRAQVLHELVDQQLGRHEVRPVEVDEVALQPRTGGPPAARAQQLVPAVGDGEARVEIGAGPADQRAEEARDEHDVLDVGAGVADPQLDGGQVGAGPDVEVDHPGVGDRARRDELGDHGVVVGGRLDLAGRTRGGPARPHQAAVAGVAGVLAAPVGRARGDGEQRREVRARPGGRPAPRRRGRARRRAPGRRRCVARAPGAGTRAACVHSGRPRRCRRPPCRPAARCPRRRRRARAARPPPPASRAACAGARAARPGSSRRGCWSRRGSAGARGRTPRRRAGPATRRPRGRTAASGGRRRGTPPRRRAGGALSWRRR